MSRLPCPESGLPCSCTRLGPVGACGERFPADLGVMGSPQRETYLRQIFYEVMMTRAMKAKAPHFYPRTLEGKFPHFMPEDIFQAFALMVHQVEMRDGQECGNCGRLEGSPDGGCDWQECPGHTRAPTVNREGHDEALSALNWTPVELREGTGQRIKGEMVCCGNPDAGRCLNCPIRWRRP